MKFAFIITATLITASGVGSILYAQSGSSVWSGVYSDAQATRGQDLYGKNCASCHGAKLEGRGQTPPLAGDDFKSNWNGQSLGDLFDKIKLTMPADRPGSLSADQNADILAFILKSNQFPSGSADLKGDSDALKQIRFESAKPKS